METEERPPRLSDLSFPLPRVQEIKSRVNALLSAPIHSPREAHNWFQSFVELSDEMAEVHTRLEIATYLDTRDERAKERLSRFEEDILSVLLKARRGLMEIYLECPWRYAMHADDRERIARELQSRKRNAGAQIARLQLEESQLVREHREFMHKMRADFMGRQVPLSILVTKMSDRNEDLRREAWQAHWRRIEEAGAQVRASFLKLRQNRLRQAELAKAPSYEDFVFTELGRLDFSPQDCQDLRQEIHREIVPLVAHLKEVMPEPERESKPWNDRILGGRMPSRPPCQGHEGKLLSEFNISLTHIHPYCSTLLEQMRENEYLDIFPRAGKAPGAFCAPLPRTKLPFVFGHFSVSTKDLFTLFHEFGHAVHSASSAEISNTLNRNPGLEFCEFVATSFEFLAHPHLVRFWGHPDDSRDARTFHLFQSASILPFAAQLDEWQSRVYAADVQDEDDLDTIWMDLDQIYRPYLSWNAQTTGQGLGWCSRPHVFSSPFYFIDYAIAHIGAWQVQYGPSASNLTRFFKALTLGGQRDLDSLFEAAGVISPLKQSGVQEAANLMRREFRKSLAGWGLVWPQPYRAEEQLS